MPRTSRDEVWIVDLGYSAKIRLCLVLSVPPLDGERVLITLVPHTTAVRGTRFELSVPKPFLRPGSFNAQGIVTVASERAIRKLGELSSTETDAVVVAAATRDTGSVAQR